MSEYEKHGYWWLPQYPENQVAGRLLFGHETRAVLHLLGSFRDTSEALKQMGTAGMVYRPDVILGLTEDGKNYTLHDCIQNGAKMNTNAFLRESFSPSMVLEGRHFDSSEDMVFQLMTVRLSHLGKWYQVTGRKISIETPESDDRKITMVYQKPPDRRIQFDGGSIEFGHDIHTKTPRFDREFSLSEEACFSIIPDKPLQLVKFLNEFLPPILHFLELGVGKLLSILEVRGKAVVDCGAGADEEIRKAPTIQLHWQFDLHGDENKELTPIDMIFTRPDIDNRLEECLRKWVSSHREILPVMLLFFGRVLDQETISANSFLNAVQAAEAYHRYRRGGTELPDIEHQERLKSVLDSCPQQHKEWLKQKLPFSNDYSLKMRMRDLLKDRSTLFELSESDIESIAKRIAKIRNSFTHYSGNDKPHFASDLDLYIYYTLLKWTMVACLLDEVGIEPAKAHELIGRNQSFANFKRVTLHKGMIEFFKIEDVNPEESITGPLPANPNCGEDDQSNVVDAIIE